jgi:hypothetical protein
MRCITTSHYLITNKVNASSLSPYEDIDLGKLPEKGWVVKAQVAQVVLVSVVLRSKDLT